MNFDKLPESPEREPHIPSLEEIKFEVERLSGNENLEIVRTLEDEKGVYLFEGVSVDEAGDGLLYSYRRAGEYLETKASNTVIDVAYFQGALEDGMFIGGKTLSDHDEVLGRWVDVK